MHGRAGRVQSFHLIFFAKREKLLRPFERFGDLGGGDAMVGDVDEADGAASSGEGFGCGEAGGGGRRVGERGEGDKGNAIGLGWS